MKSFVKLSLVVIFVITFVISGVKQSKAIPAFARKHNAPCTMCHTTIPKLNQFGYEFRANGYKTPDDFTKDDEEVNLANMYSARIQSKFVQKNTDDAGVKSNSTDLELKELSLYPISGSFNKNISSLVELTFENGGTAEIENAYVRYNWGETGNYFIKFGQMHAWEGYGASDRPLSLSKAFIIGTGTANFTPWTDQAGVTFGLIQKNTSANLTIFDGQSTNGKDFQVYANQFLGSGGAAASIYYYNGKLDPDPSNNNNFNGFNRWAIFANYPISQFNLLAGYGQGKDKVVAGANTKSGGYFGEVNANLLTAEEPGGLNVSGVLRYDMFDPDKNKDHNKITAVTAALNMPFNNGLQFILEYQQKKTEKPGTTTNTKDNKLELRAIWIF